MEEIRETKYSSILPHQFIKSMEADLNKFTEGIPDIFLQSFPHFVKNWNYPNAFEFLVGWCVGTCQTSYLQAFSQIHGIPSEEQIMEVGRIVSRRRLQIEQGVNAFLDENHIK